MAVAKVTILFTLAFTLLVAFLWVGSHRSFRDNRLSTPENAISRSEYVRSRILSRHQSYPPFTAKLGYVRPSHIHALQHEMPWLTERMHESLSSVYSVSPLRNVGVGLGSFPDPVLREVSFLQPGEKCHKKRLPCAEGYVCSCGGICVKRVHAKITLAADDQSKLFICGRKIAMTRRRTEKKVVDYSGPCSELFISVRNRKKWSTKIAGVAVAFEVDGMTYASGDSLYGVSATRPIPKGWRLGIPGFDYSDFTPVVAVPGMEKTRPFGEMISELGAYLVTDEERPRARRMAFRFVTPFCFKEVASPPPPPPALPGEKCDPTLEQPCESGYSCGCNGICVKQISARIHMLSDDVGDLLICGKKVISSATYPQVKSVDYTGPCSDLYASIRNTNGWGGVAVAVELGAKDYGSGTTLDGFSLSSNFPNGWQMGLPGFDYSAFRPIQKLNGLNGWWKGEPFDVLVNEFGAYLVGDTTNPTSSQLAFRFPAPFCFEELAPTPPPGRPALPGERCDVNLEVPCSSGFSCSCNGICVREVTAKIDFNADDSGDLYICGKKIAHAEGWTKKFEVEYTGPCSDIFFDVANIGGPANAALSVEMEGKTYSTGQNLDGMCATDGALKTGWQVGTPGFDYSAFTPVKPLPFEAFEGAFRVTNKENETPAKIGFKFSLPACFELPTPPPPPPPPPALPGEKCDVDLEVPCSSGFSCSCNGICVREVTAKIAFLADDSGDLYICGKKIGRAEGWVTKYEVEYTGPCSDIFFDVASFTGLANAAVSVEMEGKTYSTGTNLEGVCATDDALTTGWELGMPGFDYSAFTPIEALTTKAFDGAFRVTNSENDSAAKVGFKFSLPACFEPTAGNPALPHPPPEPEQPPPEPEKPPPTPEPALPGEKCDSTREQPCVPGYSCGCNGICREEITAKIHLLANDEGDLYICGKKVLSVTKYPEVANVVYTGPCADLYASVKNTFGYGGVVVAVELEGRSYGSFTTLKGYSAADNIPDGWELGTPGFDYSAFSPVEKFNGWFGRWTGEPFETLINRYGAFLVGDAKHPRAGQIAFRFPAPFCH